MKKQELSCLDQIDRNRKSNNPLFGFVILYWESNLSQLKNTIRLIGINYPRYPILCVYSKNIDKTEVDAIKVICDVCKGNGTIASLLNKGIRNISTDWALCVTTDIRLKNKIDRKYFEFLRTERDVMFAVVNRKFLFEESSLNGLFINQQTFKEVGDFPEDFESLELSRLFWKARALELNCIFKSLVGVY